MHVLYEHFTDSQTGKLLATDFLITSVFPGKNGIHFWNNQHKVLFTYVKDQIFKAIPKEQRTLDDKTFIWSFFNEAGKKVYEAVKNDPMTTQFCFLHRVENLAQMVKDGYVSEPKAVLDPEEFFYNKASGRAKARTSDEIINDLVVILAVSVENFNTMSLKERKILYNKAALRLHPDRNHDSGKAMSELNAVWQEWSKLNA